MPSRVVAAFLLFAACATSSGRYVMRVDEGSRYHFKYGFDTKTQRWANRECELRVGAARPLPVLTNDGPNLSVQMFKSISVESAYIKTIVVPVRDGYRTWPMLHVVSEDDLRGRVAYGVQVKWPREGSETRYEPLEMFRLPPLANDEPGQWSDWMLASDLREGAFAWWDEAHGQPGGAPPAPAHPFAIRCRVVLADVPGRLP